MAKGISLKKKMVTRKRVDVVPPVKEFDLDSFVDTSQVPVPKSLIEQVIGQTKCVEIIRKAAAQKRNVLLVGYPGTGKSLLAQAMSEILPVGSLQDVLVYPNVEDSNNPLVRVIKAGEGKKIIESASLEAMRQEDSSRLISLILPIGWMVISTILWQLKWYPDVVYAALILLGGVMLVGVAVGGQMRAKDVGSNPKLLVNNLNKKIAPFFDATGARAGALLGDVRHDPLQSITSTNELIVSVKGVEKKISFEKFWNKIAKKYPELVEKHEKGYEAIILPKEYEVYTLGMDEGRVVRTRIYSMNRYPFEGEVIEISLENKRVTITPEHKIFTKRGNKRADGVSEKDVLFKLDSSKLTI